MTKPKSKPISPKFIAVCGDIRYGSYYGKGATAAAAIKALQTYSRIPTEAMEVYEISRAGKPSYTLEWFPPIEGKPA